MSNIQQIFRVQMMLANDATQDYDTFYSNFEKDSQYSAAKREFFIEYMGNEWWVDTFSNHLCCVTEFNTIEAAEEAELEGYELLSSYGYWKEEE
ncbi:hypothetical protein PONTUS_181 [Vibrio phage Pontus]|uniref:Uncharacterized protein n=1 Tax=Vibrio phage Pontus TaxID=2590874 RepID=A0A4Y6E8I7_9CAUD|nr:hypothetical protein KNU59_gp122 [Vibrio phage Pontus]QDF14806.1 hypothetical protein PONTUS_181 [Vibrio phage Pontus]